MTITASNPPLSARKPGRLKSIWTALVSLEEALEFNSLQDLERRVRELETRWPTAEPGAPPASKCRDESAT